MCICNFCESLRTARVTQASKKIKSCLFFQQIGVLWSLHVGQSWQNKRRVVFHFGVQHVETQHVKHNFYRHLLFWFIYTLLFWNFRHRLVRHYWYIRVSEPRNPKPLMMVLVLFLIYSPSPPTHFTGVLTPSCDPEQLEVFRQPCLVVVSRQKTTWFEEF